LNGNLQTIKNIFSRRFINIGYSGIFEKFGVPSRTAAVAKALQLGIITLDEIYKVEQATFHSYGMLLASGEKLHRPCF